MDERMKCNKNKLSNFKQLHNGRLTMKFHVSLMGKGYSHEIQQRKDKWQKRHQRYLWIMKLFEA